MSNPQDYEGKIIKMKGTFQVYEGELQNYYVCSISDTTACCSAGMEFILKGGRKYPDDYPALNDEITVTGEFETYLEGDKKYCHLINAKLG